MEKVKKGVYYNMKSKYCILMVLAVILINCILYGCSEKNQNISELPDGISIKKSTIKGKENDEILVIKKLNNENYKNVQGYIKTNSDFTEISIVFKNTNNESNDIELEYLPKIEWPKHDIIWNLYLYDGRSLEQFSKLDDIYYMKINSAAEVNLTSLDNVRYLEIHNADITEKSNIGDMKKLISVTFQNCTVDGIGECSKLENLAQIVIYDGKCMSLSGLQTCNNDICLDIPYVKINQNAINDLQNVNISSMIIDSDFEGNLSQLKNISMIDVFGENISQQLISNISEIDSLEKIKLHGSINNEDIAIMKQSQNLKGLDINGLDISDLTPVASLTNIEELDISNTNVTDLSPLKDMPNLKKLIAENCNIDDWSPVSDIDEVIK